MAQLLSGKVVIITGGARGIGAEIAKLAAQEGARVVINDLGSSERGEGRSQQEAEVLAQELRSAGFEAVSNGATVATTEGAQDIVQAALQAFGRVDCVINNAGVLRDKIFHKMEPADWQIVLNVNLTGAFNVARAAAPYFKEQSSGSFVHLTSTNGVIGGLAQVNYGAAKAGVAALSRNIALDMARFGVRSNCVAPFAWTRMVATIPMDTEQNKHRIEVLKKMTPAKIAPLVVALASDAAKEVTGQIFAVRKDEIFLFNQPRPIRSAHCAEGWTAQACVERLLPAFRSALTPLERSADVFCWEPL